MEDDLRRESLCTDTACGMASGRSSVCVCVHTIGTLTPYGIAYVFDCIYTQRAVHFPPFFPLHQSEHQFIPRHCWTPVLGKRKCCYFCVTNTKGNSPGNERHMTVITRTLIIQRIIFLDQFYELLRFFFGDFADLRHGFSTGRKNMAENGTRSDKNKGRARPLTYTA